MAMGGDHDNEGPSLRPLVLVAALFLGALAAALGTAGPTGSHLQHVNVAPAHPHAVRPALLTSEHVSRR
jgi:hypothetical protein